MAQYRDTLGTFFLRYMNRTNLKKLAACGVTEVYIYEQILPSTLEACPQPAEA
jgi:hypothetical protein